MVWLRVLLAALTLYLAPSAGPLWAEENGSPASAASPPSTESSPPPAAQPQSPPAQAPAVPGASQATQPPPPAGETTPLSDEDSRVLSPEEKAEKQSRKACKIEICDILATKNADGPEVDCDITKTWREEDLVKMLGNKSSWPWGKAVCKSKLALAREMLAKAMSEADYQVALPTQKVRCTLDRKEGGEPYVVDIELAPKVKFKDGKAVDASLNWGKASAPMLIYPLIYAGTGLDNSTNVLGPIVTRMVNEFTTKKCAAVKTELPSNKGQGETAPAPSNSAAPSSASPATGTPESKP